jgi:hypothetical protein
MSPARLALASAVAALALSCDAVAADRWRVAAALIHDGRQFAKASAIVSADRPATVKVDGEEGYSLSFDIEEIGRGQLRLNTILVSAYGSMSPAVVIRPGQTANIAIDHLGLVMKVFPEGGKFEE